MGVRVVRLETRPIVVLTRGCLRANYTRVTLGFRLGILGSSQISPLVVSGVPMSRRQHRSQKQIESLHRQRSPVAAFSQHSFEAEVGRRVTVLPSGCWALDGKVAGRPTLYVKGQARLVKAYRWMYEELVGEVPAKHVLHHECLNGWCVNPRHLTPLTPGEHASVHRRST